MKISLSINGRPHNLEIDSRELLVDILRSEGDIKSARTGCHTGDCGACTVRVDGEVRKSCLILAASADGVAVETVSAPNKWVEALQQSFVRCGGFQCGFCTPGMLTVAADLLSRNPDPTESTIRHAISGNLCRCTGYDSIVSAITEAASALRSQEAAHASLQAKDSL
jgi:carbon-monoxide dehydrogenase small subunit